MSVGFYLRVQWVAWWYRVIFARLSGQRDIVRQNLRVAFPDQPAWRHWLMRGRILSAQGRFYGELLNMDRLLPMIDRPRIEGPGAERFLQAVEAGRPVILLTGHVGNYVAGLHMLTLMGIEAGFLYRTRGNVLLDSRFDTLMRRMGQRGFKIGHRSTRQYEPNLKDFIEFLAEGHVAVMLGDHRDRRGAKLPFLGKRAPTSLTPAKLALAHDAPLIPAFVLRDGRKSRFRVWMDAPIRPGTPEAMMRRFNAAAGKVIEEDPAQWSWTIRRW